MLHVPRQFLLWLVPHPALGSVGCICLSVFCVFWHIIIIISEESAASIFRVGCSLSFVVFVWRDYEKLQVKQQISYQSRTPPNTGKSKGTVVHVFS
jgi:hypothetical protein